jgi:hypothetical protein
MDVGIFLSLERLITTALPLEPTLWIQRLVMILLNELLLVAGLLSTCRALLFSERRKAPAHIKFTHPDKEVK